MSQHDDVRSIHSAFQEYGRGVAGGLLFSLPLLYTMEAWWTGFNASPQALLFCMIGTFILLLGYNRFAGIRRDAGLGGLIMESVEEMGLGILIATLILWLLGRIHAGMVLPEIAGKVVVEAMAVAIGVSVGTAQLGGGEADADGDGQDDRNPPQPSGFGGQLVIGFCGAVLFAANVAPTEEILLIAIETPPWKLLVLAVLSLLVGGFVLFYANFIGADRVVVFEGFFDVFFGVVVMYAIALLASALMLWFFGRLEGLAVSIWLEQTVVLAMPATLGALARTGWNGPCSP